MKVSDISELDAKSLIQVRNLLKLLISEVKFSLGDARIVDQTIKWFDAFMKACEFVQNEENKKKQENTPIPTKKEGLSSVKIKDFSPGTLPVRKTKKPTRKK